MRIGVDIKGYKDGRSHEAQFEQVSAMTASLQDNSIFLVDYGIIRKISPDGMRENIR